MQKLIADYLFEYKQCALPQIGTLKIKRNAALSIIETKAINAPVSTIYFTDEITDSRNITEYIAANKNISIDEAAYQLKKICEEISLLNNDENFDIAGVGQFYKSGNGRVSFTAVELPAYFYPSVYAERVIHPDDSHEILVGDTETDRNTMTKYYTEEKPAKKSKWWVGALMLFVIAAALVVFYLNDKSSNSFFGIQHKYDVAPAAETYKTLP
ncbi:MAG: hypothetical protein ACKVOM_05790 [Ferruginibacter sp.]